MKIPEFEFIKFNYFVLSKYKLETSVVIDLSYSYLIIFVGVSVSGSFLMETPFLFTCLFFILF